MSNVYSVVLFFFGLIIIMFAVSLAFIIAIVPDDGQIRTKITAWIAGILFIVGALAMRIAYALITP